MFFPPPASPPAAAGEAGEEKYTVELRRRGDGEHSREPRARPRTWSRAPDSLEKIEESEAESGARNPRTGYSLSGYLYIITNKMHLPALKGLGTAPKKRWFVYSDSVCKLYYYKQKDESEPLGMIDISLATFYFDPENKNEGQFSIRWGNKEIVLEALSAQGRTDWLEQLQTARREFSHRRTATKTPASKTTSTKRPETGLIQEDNKASIADIPDPHHDLQLPVMRSADSDLPSRPHSTPLSLAISNLLPHTPKIFKGSPSSESLRSPTSPLGSRNSITSSPTEDLSFGNLSRRLRSSLRGRKSHEGKEVTEVTNVHKPATCKKCEELQADLIMMQEEHTATQDEYQASREVISVLQKELESLQQEKATLISLDRSDLTDHHVIEILRGKDRRIVQLEHETQESAKEIAHLEEELSRARQHHEHLSEKISMLYCLVEAKDKAIVSLTHEIDVIKPPTPNNFTSMPNSCFYSYPSSPASPSFPHDIPEFVTRGTQTSDMEDDVLKDSVEAYKAQNLFLNKEILELNLLRKHAADREDKLITESSEWEAKFYQIQSKYLLLLNELHSPQAGQHDRSIVSQLLQDVVGARDPPALKVLQSKGREYDEYGFCITAPEDGTLEAKAAYLQKQSQALAYQAQQGASSWESKWESFLAGTSAKELHTCPELKYLIRGSIPYQYKGKVWRLLIEAEVHPLKAALPSNYYQDLLARHTSSSSTLDPATKQIELDLLRTLPNNRHYETFFSDGIAKLRRVLLAFSRHNPQVGYCQGLNRLAAIALLFLNEEDAFWCLIYIVEYLMPPDYYNKHLLGSQVDQRVLKDLVAEKLPRLSNHLARHGLDISLFTFNWFLCVYIDIIPPITYLTIWDSFLYEGSKVLFRYALAIFKLCEEGILERCDYMEIFTYLRSVPDPITDIPRLQEVAFQRVNPLSKNYLRKRREYHRAIVEAELAEVEAMRKSYHAAKAAKEAKEAPDALPATPVNSPPSTEDEGEGDTDPSSSPKAAEGQGGGSGGRGGVGLHFGALRSVVFERKDEVSHKIDEASVEASDKGRE
ncbi:TBC1 domain family member 2B-like [Eriocheir sinensis]|uniref:TBC1 domain family member 2B-like n=1 Tax=Eriocheir sinensis TaxID=95602 RepID=UPI0021CA410A|nr:TBC1 domain family member 2B-like [Eriocheir sinensis]